MKKYIYILIFCVSLPLKAKIVDDKIINYYTEKTQEYYDDNSIKIRNVLDTKYDFFIDSKIIKLNLSNGTIELQNYVLPDGGPLGFFVEYDNQFEYLGRNKELLAYLINEKLDTSNIDNTILFSFISEILSEKGNETIFIVESLSDIRNIKYDRVEYKVSPFFIIKSLFMNLENETSEDYSYIKYYSVNGWMHSLGDLYRNEIKIDIENNTLEYTKTKIARRIFIDILIPNISY